MNFSWIIWRKKIKSPIKLLKFKSHTRYPCTQALVFLFMFFHMYLHESTFFLRINFTLYFSHLNCTHTSDDIWQIMQLALSFEIHANELNCWKGISSLRSSVRCTECNAMHDNTTQTIMEKKINKINNKTTVSWSLQAAHNFFFFLVK